ncbi:MAG: YlbF family regulator [Oscillospiraceae bacterium]|nr:YlbF family regulator [Oscillospiraceae bacterium]
MADLMEMAKQLGKELQKDERYLAFRKAAEENDEDMALQTLIAGFNQKRLDLSNAEDAAVRDEERIAALDKETREIYNIIMAEPHMIAYQAARAEFEQLLDGINRVIAISAAGQDPDTYDPAAGGCSGNCSACAGCH